MISEFKERLEKRHERCWELKKDGKKIVAYFYGLVPKEIIHAAGLFPIQLIEERNPQYEEKSELLPYLCGMSKNLTGQIYDKVFDYVDGIMVATVCDTNRHVFDIWDHRKLFPHMLLVRAPSMATDIAVKYYTEELKRLGNELEKISGQKVTEDSLRESIALYNENRTLFGQFYDLRPKTGVSAEDTVNVFSSALVTPVEEHNEMMRRLLTSLPSSPDDKEEIRLMLCAINLNMAIDVIRMCEKFGAAVVTDDFTHNARYGSNYIETDGDPFEALARGYLRKVPAPGFYSFEERAMYIREMMEKADAKGMIYLIQLYCDAYAIEYAILKERFDAWNLVNLKLEAEDTPSSIEQLNVRIQSFVESLL
ncbi:MAG: 2-hydroxyacyl-CoA dehydratase [Desulfobacteraceae bacterium]|nr:2-hydroxyacyl-CoA dehydratase [Desulfobacteraceae bacterium]